MLHETTTSGALLHHPVGRIKVSGHYNYTIIFQIKFSKSVVILTLDGVTQHCNPENNIQRSEGLMRATSNFHIGPDIEKSGLTQVPRDPGWLAWGHPCSSTMS